MIPANEVIDLDIKLDCKNADETLAKIREVWDGLESIKQSIQELSRMGIELEIIQPDQSIYLREDEDTPCEQHRQHIP